ncbi:glycosyl transferase family 2 [Comamonas serinivorans]|uniref:Glycosyl transferase family 2 n=1 Tax=Comamonas serinivorans TaxID=1082851 RepID=A0A1Y0ERL0_9BURK|nr:methyltransferase domain-containing protein [Comamonas serinivorans]ARU06287.1 glycosyl transferase family 2 [Comamonas serinivorans]
MTTRHPSLHVYERTIDLSERTSLSVIASQIPPHARILDLGCGSGAIGQYLSRQGAAVTIDGLTISDDEARLARAVYRRVEVANLDDCDLVALFGQGQYDVIVCADVLEHVRGSERVLAQCRQLLAPGGKALLSIPNAGYAGLIAELMAGEFRYRAEGLLDETHVRFFTRQTLLRFLQAGGWAVDRFEVIERALPESEFQVAFDAMPPAVARYLLALPDAQTYQFIVSTHPDAARTAAEPMGGAQSTALTEDTHFPAQPLFSAELFTALNGNFQQEGKLRARGVIGQSPQTLHFALPDQPFDSVKFDPADRPGFFRFFAARLVDAHGTLLWQWQASEAPRWLTQAPSAGIVFPPAWDMAPALVGLLHGDDPWVRLPIPPQALLAAQGGSLDIDVGWPMSADYQALAGVAQDLQLAIDRLHEAKADGEQTRDARIHALSAQLRALQVERNHLALQAEQNDALRQQKQDLLSQCNVLSRERDQAVAHVHTIENSTVFRATRPIVHAKMRLDRLLGRSPAGKDPETTMSAPESHPVTPPSFPVDVIVPVYKGLADTQLCVNSVLHSTCQTPWRLLIINDASPEPEVTAWLREVAQTDARITLLENGDNLGFVGTVNRGMAASGEHDVLLLNSDAEVAGDWLDRIRASAYSDRQVASVTPFSNNATICSYPRFCQDNDLASGWTTAELDQLMAATNPGQAVDVPTGVGFCMYIRRDALNALGLFDVEHFGKGYGEENDFCIRAQNAGWRNLHLLDTFVHHSGGVSFGDAKSPRERAAMETLRRLHPQYEGDVIRFLKRDPAQLARLAADVRRVLREPRPVILAVLHDRAGGTERHVDELAARLASQALFLVLRPAKGQRLSLRLAGSDEAFELLFQLPDECDALVGVLRAFGVSHIHFHHLLGHGPEVMGLPRRLGASYDFTAHDYHVLTPQITLTDATSRYTGEDGSGNATLARDEPLLPAGDSIHAWRKRHVDFFMAARYVLAPSRDVLSRLSKLAPAAPFRHVPHTDLAGLTLPAPQPAARGADRPLRIVVIGALSAIKGADLLEDVATAARKQQRPLEFHLIGYGYRKLRTLPKANLTVHGAYEEEELPELLTSIAPDLVWFPALWPETYSYTLSACLQGGWPVVVPDIGAFGERVAGRAWSWIQPWNTDVGEWLAFFDRVRGEHFATGTPPALPTHHEDPATVAALQHVPAQPATWYSDAYLQHLPVASHAGPDRAMLAAHLPSRYTHDLGTETRSGALSALVWLRSLPVLSSVARAIPQSMQTRVKSWLVR